MHQEAHVKIHSLAETLKSHLEEATSVPVAVDESIAELAAESLASSLVTAEEMVFPPSATADEIAEVAVAIPTASAESLDRVVDALARPSESVDVMLASPAMVDAASLPVAVEVSLQCSA